MRPSNSSPKKRRKKGSSKKGLGSRSAPRVVFLTDEILTTEAFACLAMATKGCPEMLASPACWGTDCAARAIGCWTVTSDGGEQATPPTMSRSVPQTNGTTTCRWIDVLNRLMSTPPSPARIDAMQGLPQTSCLLCRDLSTSPALSVGGQDRCSPARALGL